MNIAVFIKRTTLHKGFGGLETQNKQLCEGLSSLGHTICVYSPKGELKEERIIVSGIQYKFIECVYRLLFPKFIKKHWFNLSLAEFKKDHVKNKYDLVISQSTAAYSIIRNKVNLNVPVITIAHGTIIGEIQTFYTEFKASKKSLRQFKFLITNTGFALYNFFSKQREVVHGSNAIVCVSSFVKDTLINETFAPEEKFVVINNGVDERGFENINQKDKNANRILYVGRLEKSKGVLTLLDIAKDPRFEKFTFDIVGDGNLYEEMFNQIKSRGITNVNLHGNLSYDVVKNFYSNERTLLFAFPTKRIEGFPMVLVEAMLSGLCVVAFDMGGVRDAVIDMKTGFLVKKEDIEGFKSKMLEVLNDHSMWGQITSTAIDFAKVNFTLKTMIEKYESVIEKVCK